MADYSKWKVTELKAELKNRGIAQTGLRVKQQFIDRLVEDDSTGDTDATNGEPPAAQEPAQETSQPAPVAESQTQEQEPTQAQAGPPQQRDSSVSQEQHQPEQTLVADQPTEPAPPSQPEPSAEEPPGEADTAQPTQSSDNQAPPVPQAQPDASAPPVELAPNAAAQQAAPADTESPEVTEPTAKNVAPIPASDVNTELSTPLPPDEILEDQKKRKRRSQSPVPTAEALANKKIKAQEEGPKVVLPEDKNGVKIDGNAPQDTSVQEKSEESPAPVAEKLQEPGTFEESKAKKDHLSKQDVRFKELFSANEPEPPRLASPPRDVDMEAEVEPAQHAATAALYVDGLMRPLQPAALRNHLVSLACPPGDSPNADMILDFYLDPIKTHCFVSFTNVSAASRVRAALHNTVWPNERNRKSLFVDFIPEGKLQEWVDTETSRKRGGPPPRFEVKYNRTDGGVEAVLQEIGSRSAPGRGPEPSDFSRPPPLGPRADMAPKDRRPSDQPAPERPPQPGQGFKPLDELFMSTTAKPKLYYLPVPRSVADRRLDRFDDLLRKGAFPRRGGDEPRRISFEDEDLFVDNGPEFGGRRRGGGRGGGRGRGRGGFGDSWRDDRRGRF
ncbi:hypothetical protein BDV59DRAFT_185247 [Aspergillus ambiguus]|uniref:SAP domain protein n=1 Tax=Aspergillus ambiguus TaxID=176160 RepID=UPI003CCCA6D9